MKIITEKVLDEMREELKKHIGDHRLAHSLSVESEAYMLATLFGLDEQTTLKLRAAAILHDVTKSIDTIGQISLCKEYGIALTLDDISSPKVLHSISGAEMAKRLFPDYVDGEIYGMILNHTTGAAKMTLCEKLLYLADYIEPKRTFFDCLELRGFFYEADTLPTEKHLNKTLLLSFDMTLKVLLNESQPIHPKTVSARNGIIEELNLKI